MNELHLKRASLQPTPVLLVSLQVQSFITLPGVTNILPEEFHPLPCLQVLPFSEDPWIFISRPEPTPELTCIGNNPRDIFTRVPPESETKTDLTIIHPNAPPPPGNPPPSHLSQEAEDQPQLTPSLTPPSTVLSPQKHLLAAPFSVTILVQTIIVGGLCLQLPSWLPHQRPLPLTMLHGHSKILICHAALLLHILP